MNNQLQRKNVQSIGLLILFTFIMMSESYRIEYNERIKKLEKANKENNFYIEILRIQVNQLYDTKKQKSS